MLNVSQSLPKSKDLFPASLYEPCWVGHPILASPNVHQVWGEPENYAENILALWSWPSRNSHSAWEIPVELPTLNSVTGEGEGPSGNGPGLSQGWKGVP